MKTSSMRSIPKFNSKRREIKIMQLHSTAIKQEWFKQRNKFLGLENIKSMLTNGTKELTIYYSLTSDTLSFNIFMILNN